MSALTDRIKNHAVFSELTTFGPVLDRAAALDNPDVSVIDGLERLRAVLAFCGKRLAATDPFLAHPAPFSTIQSNIAAARGEVEAYISDRNAAHVVTANTQADQVLIALADVLSPLALDDLTIISAAAGSYRTTLEAHLKTAQETITRLLAEESAIKASLQQLSGDIAAEKQKLSSALNEQQSNFSAAQDKRAQDFTAAQTDRQEKAATVAAEHQTQFTAGQTERLEKYNALIAEHRKLLAAQDMQSKGDLAASLKKSEEGLAGLRGSFEAAAQAVLDEINKHKSDVEKLVGVIGNLGVTSGYQKAANTARNALYLWQGLTVASLGFLIFIAYVIVFSPPAADPAFYHGMATRVFLSLTIGIFAAYAARQASNSWQVERQNRKLALELEALGPYISSLPIEMQHKFRVDVGDRSFGVADGLGKLADGSPVTAMDLLKTKELRDFVTDIVKAAK